MSNKRNIILITIDSLRADHCSFMGYERETTPTIDKMAKNGLCYKNAMAASLPTPTSMFSVFTSDHLNFGSPLHAGLSKQFHTKKTIAEILSKKGYNTIAFNKNPYIPFQKGFGRGFDTLKGYSESGIHNLLYKAFKVNQDMADLILGSGISGSCMGELYEIVVEILKNAERPYFLWILVLDTHVPYLPGKRKYSSQMKNWFINYKLRKKHWEGELNSNEKKKLVNAYDDCILNADRFVKELKKETKSDDPIFIIHADHGDGLGEHNFYHHPPMLYEELIHVPLVIYNAGVTGKFEKPVSLRSLAPTILELIGEKNEFPSQSILNGGSDYVISKVFDSKQRKVSLRMLHWKYIEGQEERGELFNLENDPKEQENLVDEYPVLVREFSRIIEIHNKTEDEKRNISSKLRTLDKSRI